MGDESLRNRILRQAADVTVFFLFTFLFRLFMLFFSSFCFSSFYFLSPPLFPHPFLLPIHFPLNHTHALLNSSYWVINIFTFPLLLSLRNFPHCSFPRSLFLLFLLLIFVFLFRLSLLNYSYWRLLVSSFSTCSFLLFLPVILFFFSLFPSLLPLQFLLNFPLFLHSFFLSFSSLLPVIYLLNPPPSLNHPHALSLQIKVHQHRHISLHHCNNLPSIVIQSSYEVSGFTRRKNENALQNDIVYPSGNFSTHRFKERTILGLTFVIVAILPWLSI